jgi:hypothetical protein
MCAAALFLARPQGDVALPPTGLLKEFITSEVLQPLAEQLGADNAETRGVLAGSHLIGIAFTRYVLNVESVASLGREELVACVAPAVQRYLTGDLPLA